MVEKERPEVWDILDEVISEHPVMLNRAPTLHRLGIQAFEPVLIEGKAIQLHPLVCAAFNADFDGDQMAVHVPLSVEAQMEARVLMMSTNNILSPANGKPDHQPDAGHRARALLRDARAQVRQGLVPRRRAHVRQEGEKLDGYLRGVFASPDEVRMAYDDGEVDLHAGVRVRVDRSRRRGQRQRTRMMNTTVGRVLVSEILPDEIPFDYVNKTLTRRRSRSLIDICYRKHRNKATVLLADRLRSLGFEYATKAGISICMEHMVIPDEEEGADQGRADRGRARRRPVPGRSHHRRRALQQDRRHLGRRRRQGHRAR